jgi:hypothetical protein
MEAKTMNIKPIFTIHDTNPKEIALVFQKNIFYTLLSRMRQSQSGVNKDYEEFSQGNCNSCENLLQ